MVLTSDRQFHNYKANEDRVFLKDGLMLRKNYVETGNVKNCQILMQSSWSMKYSGACTENLASTPGIIKRISAYRQKYYYTNTAQLIRQRVMSCEQCIGVSRVDDRFTRAALQNSSEHITAAEDAMQIDLVPELPPSVGYENIVTSIDVFTRYLFVSWLYPAKMRN